MNVSKLEMAGALCEYSANHTTTHSVYTVDTAGNEFLPFQKTELIQLLTNIAMGFFFLVLQEYFEMEMSN